MAQFAFHDSLSHTHIQGNVTSTDGLSGSVNYYINMYAIYLNIWMFGRDQSRNGIWTKKPLRTYPLFSNFDKKLKISRFGRDLAKVWNIQIFGYLKI